MKPIILALAFVALVTAAALAGTEFCSYSGETVDGLNKICFYSCPSGHKAITIKNIQLCPISLR